MPAHTNSKTPKRILHITRLAKGGVSVVVRQLVGGLNKCRFEPVVLFDTPQSSEIRDSIISSKIQTIELYKSRDLLLEKKRNKQGSQGAMSPGVKDIKQNYFLLKWYLFFKSACRFFLHEFPRISTFYRLFKENKIDLVHTHSDFRKAKPEIIGARLAGIPILTHRHGYASYTGFDSLFLKLSQANIYISNNVADYHIGKGEPREKGHVVHNGIDLIDYTRKTGRSQLQFRQEFSCAATDVLVGLVARIDWWKGHEYFIEAMSIVVQENNNCKGFIIGGLAEMSYETSSRYNDTLLNMVDRLDLQEKIIFTGHRTDVADVVAELDIIVHASSTPEPFGLTVIEGMAAGKPVIATAAGGVLDIIDDEINGLLVPCKDSNAMADAILKIISNQNKAQKIGSKAQQKVAREFTVEKQVSKIELLYEQVLSSKRE